MENIKKRLKARLKGKIVIFGMGNPLRGDDGLGSDLIGRMEGKTGAYLVDGGSAPENYVGKIALLKPDTILVIDVCKLGYVPGKIKLLEIDKIKNTGHSTHRTSPRVFMDYLKETTGADVFMLAVQPGELRLGKGFSAPIEKAIERIEEWLKDMVRKKSIT